MCCAVTVVVAAWPLHHLCTWKTWSLSCIITILLNFYCPNSINSYIYIECDVRHMCFYCKERTSLQSNSGVMKTDYFLSTPCIGEAPPEHRERKKSWRRPCIFSSNTKKPTTFCPSWKYIKYHFFVHPTHAGYPEAASKSHISCFSPYPVIIWLRQTRCYFKYILAPNINLNDFSDVFLAPLDDRVHMHTPSICKQREREQGPSELPHIPQERCGISPTRQHATHQHLWKNQLKKPQKQVSYNQESPIWSQTSSVYVYWCH